MFAKSRRATISSVMSVCPSVRSLVCVSVCLSVWNNSAPNQRLLINSDIGVFFEKLTKNSNFFNSDKNNATLHEDLRTFMIISRSIFLKREFSDKILEEIKTHFLFNNFFSENRAVNETMRKNIVEPDRPQMTI